ncbi:P-loop containing nucleoside triphosphate hydrolase protein [Penicillium chermesinum]|uniref:P-loop containing nucleoside triphosphate hydrolase protein n=1 Tax=Penicillium chermesinum TaxID=63820 RepID=A0A9W9TYV5_9EURO|nr:P-loop containing nucleoside triphosphate hydrolase protein [Penicillium chermesinum]KAJ5249004.1 P-loop containing nucleoside triphosphate hydrolase protein [Penicillium chermesinum]
MSFGASNSGLQANIINGSRNGLERPKTPPTPLSTVPFRRDPDFVDRGTLLDEIDEKAVHPGARVGLVGIGGVGKSQLAIEYTYRVRDRSPETWVFWVHASNATRFEQDCRTIAHRAKIASLQGSSADIFQVVSDWLHDTRRKWVLVLDNLDDDSFLHRALPAKQENAGDQASDVSGRTIWDYFPQSLSGLILITSRVKHMVARIVDDNDVISIQPMQESHAVALFERKVGVAGKEEDASQLVAALDFMPLAIVQAAAYIKHRAPRSSVEKYLAIFQGSDHKKAELLAHEGGQLRRDRDTENAIFATWQISFDHLYSHHRSAADLLSIMSFFDRQGIPEFALQYRVETGDLSDVEEDSASNSITFEDNILLLRNYSLISVSPDGTTFELHHLVQLAVQQWLKNHDQFEKTKNDFIYRLFQSLHEPGVSSRTNSQLLHAHIQRAVEQRPRDDGPLELWGNILLHAACTMAIPDIRNFLTIVTLTYQALKETFGPDHKYTLHATLVLSSAYQGLGKLQEAEELQNRLIEVHMRSVGPGHFNTLQARHQLSVTYLAQGRWKEAEDLQWELVKISKRLRGSDDFLTLSIMKTLAKSYKQQERWKDARELGVQVMEAYQRTLGPMHPLFLRSIVNLFELQTCSGHEELKITEGRAIQALETLMGILGPDHPETLISMVSLANTYRHLLQGRWKEAEDLRLKILRGSGQALNQDTLKLLGLAEEYGGLSINITTATWNLLRKRERLQEHAMETRKQFQGKDHPDSLRSMQELTDILMSSSQDKAARCLMTERIIFCEQALGFDRPGTISSNDG